MLLPSMSALERGFCRSGPWTLLTTRLILPWALQGVQPQGEVLELGAGSGGMAEAMISRFPGVRVTVTDVDPAMVHAARHRFMGQADTRVEQVDATDLPYDDHAFDYVVSFLMLHHVIDWHGALAEASRVLRPGGRLVGYDLAKTRIARWVHVADRSPHRPVRTEELAPQLTRAGFGSIAVDRSFHGHVVHFVAEKP